MTSEFEITEGPNHYHMSSPSVHVEHPHKPKLRRLQISNLVELCETEFHSTKTLNLVDYDYDLCGVPPSKNIDALGILSTQNNMELIVVESSSGRLKEHTTHTIEDSLKILECGMAALKKRLFVTRAHH
ncbi:hypothetical protein MFLAVUS_009561 [Mucor flavus]|uniref:Uncharacterized protein n=1 Tax=Mucor flavus TaxID=439312 RepID=A0ABP9ZAG8_9FUNG